MLNKIEFTKILEIIEKAQSDLDEAGLPDYNLQSVTWNDDEGYWEVQFYSDYGSSDYTTVLVQPVKNGFITCGHNYESSKV